MSGQAQPAHEDVRPGFVKRPSNFSETLARARAWRWDGETVWQVEKAVLRGTPHLSPGARHLLQLYLSCLYDEDLQKGDARVFPGSRILELEAGCVDRTIRRHRRELEACGYIVCRFNKANRPEGTEAVDLTPTIARLAELEATTEAARQQRAAERATWQAPALENEGDVRPGGQICPPEQSNEKRFSSVRGRAPSARPDRLAASTSVAGRSQRARPSAPPHQPADPDVSAICSPRRASGSAGARSPGSVDADLLQEELRLARRACPELAALVPARVYDDPLTVQHVDVGMVVRAAHQLLPEKNRNNGWSAKAGFDRHGARVVVMLAVALTDPNARDRCRYFGGFVNSDAKALDLRPNLRRVLKLRGGDPAALGPPPGADNPIWQALDAELQRLLGQGDYGAWFGDRIGFLGLVNGMLNLSAPNELMARKIVDLSDTVLAAAEAAHLAVHRVSCVVRRTPKA